MEIKEKDLYLAKLLEKNAIKQDEFEDIEYKPEINAFDSKYLKQSFVDKINFGWSVWQEQATPKGFVLMPKHISDEMNDHLWDFMTDNFISTNEDGDSYIACDDFDLGKFYSEIIEAQEQSHELD